MSKYVLSIDEGTTGVTILVFDHDGRVVSRAYSEFAQHYPHPGWVEHDAEEIWRTTLRLIGEALREGGMAPGDLTAIGITNQRESSVLWDRKTGVPVTPSVCWQDRRSAAICDDLKARGLEEEIRRRTGLVVDAYFSGTKVKWLLDNTPGLRERAERGEIAFGTIDSWLVYKLTGGRVHITDYSNASRTLMYNIYALEWDELMLSLLDIPGGILPEVRPSSQVYGETDPALLGAAVPVAGIAGDQQAALFGQACYEAGMAKNTYGTGSFVLMNTGHTPTRDQKNLLTTIAWGIDGEPVEYALEGAIFVTGAAVQWLRDGLGIVRQAAETEELARSLEGNDGVYFVPALVGLGAPHWDPYARGALLGITRGTTGAHLARAVLESMCYQTRDVVETMQRESGVTLRELRCDGGAAVNSFLMQFQADILGVTVEVPEITETTALGAAYLAGLATGFWSGRRELQEKWRLASRYTPSMDPEQRERLYSRWGEAVNRSRNWDGPAR